MTEGDETTRKRGDEKRKGDNKRLQFPILFIVFPQSRISPFHHSKCRKKLLSKKKKAEYTNIPHLKFWQGHYQE